MDRSGQGRALLGMATQKKRRRAPVPPKLLNPGAANHTRPWRNQQVDPASVGPKAASNQTRPGVQQGAHPVAPSRGEIEGISERVALTGQGRSRSRLNSAWRSQRPFEPVRGE